MIPSMSAAPPPHVLIFQKPKPPTLQGFTLTLGRAVVGREMRLWLCWWGRPLSSWKVKFSLSAGAVNLVESNSYLVFWAGTKGVENLHLHEGDLASDLFGIECIWRINFFYVQFLFFFLVNHGALVPNLGLSAWKKFLNVYSILEFVDSLSFSYLEAHLNYGCPVTGPISVKTGFWDVFGFLMATCNFSSAGNNLLRC